MPLAHGVRSRTQIIVGTSISSIATTVKTASSNEITIDWYSASSATRFVHACMVRPPAIRLRVEKSAIAYSGNRKNTPKATHSTARNTLPPNVLRLIAATSQCACTNAL